jgi:glycosyltransferase involved in cell wall biosynthesis
MPNPVKITHLITGLCAGGAEIMLLRLLSRTDRAWFHPDVISMMGDGPTGRKIQELGIRVRELGLQRNLPDPFALPKLVRWLRDDRPDVLATWMYHANFLGSLAAPLAGGMPVVWGLHHGRLDPSLERKRTLWIARACGWMSHRLVDTIVCCSECSREEHLLLGYDAKKMVVIRNGFDLTKFRPDPEARQSVRRDLRISEDAPVVCLVARYHPEKGHRSFVEAAALIRRRVPAVQFVLCGHDVTWQNRALASVIDAAGLRDCSHLLGLRDDVACVLNASDIACSASLCEALSLAIGEAMCCGIPCVVTDVGDSAVLVGDAGLTVPAADSRALADACTFLLQMPEPIRRGMGQRARKRVQQNFELSQTVARYQAVYARLAKTTVPRAPADYRDEEEQFADEAQATHDLRRGR